MDLDRTDVQILRALQADARLSYRELARRLAVSVPTVSVRVANLERIGVLSGYHAVVDPDRLRQTRVVLLLRCRQGTEDAVGAALADLVEIRWTVRTEGSRIVAEAFLETPDLVPRLLERVRGIDGIHSVEHHIATKSFKDAPRAVVPEGAAAIVSCFECGRVIEGDPVRWRADGRTHYLCCTSCEKLYRERYLRVRAGALQGQSGGNRRGPRGARLSEHARRRV